MKPLIVLISIFTIIIVSQKLLGQRVTLIRAGRIAMSAMMVFAATAHFTHTSGMAHMLPSYVSIAELIVIATGIFEIVLAAAMLSDKWARAAGRLLIAFLITVLPANIYAAINQIDPLTGSSGGPGPEYLLVRVPLQLFFIAWVYVFTIAPQRRIISIIQNTLTQTKSS